MVSRHGLKARSGIERGTEASGPEVRWTSTRTQTSKREGEYDTLAMSEQLESLAYQKAQSGGVNICSSRHRQTN
jgi:hypothetical protein